VGRKSILIIGAGMGGLAAGIYGQVNGYDTEIYEMHSSPGGQCAAWQRQGYTFDACIHHLMGCKDGSSINQLWQELGALPRELVAQRESVAFVSSSGEMFYHLNDLELLREEMLAVAPEDRDEIEEYIKRIRSFAGKDMMGALLDGSKLGMAGLLGTVAKNRKYMTMPLGEYAKRYKSPLLRRALALAVYSLPDAPTALHFAKQASAAEGDILWPLGGSAAFAGSIAERYQALGGVLHLGQKVVGILTERGRAIGVELAGGERRYADIVVSDADGRKTIYELLGGRYTTAEIEQWAKPPTGETNWGTMVYLGVNRDLSDQPSALVMLLDEPVTLTGRAHGSLEMQIYGFDPSMAAPGKGVIKVEMVTPFSYWNCASEAEYEDKKRQVTEQVIVVLGRYFGGIADDVEVSDVVTLRTWERFMGGTHGFANMPNKPFNMNAMLTQAPNTLPGLAGFYMVGVWVSSTGALFANAATGKRVIRELCKQDKRRFKDAC